MSGTVKLFVTVLAAMAAYDLLIKKFIPGAKA